MLRNSLEILTFRCHSTFCQTDRSSVAFCAVRLFLCFTLLLWPSLCSLLCHWSLACGALPTTLTPVVFSAMLHTYQGAPPALLFCWIRRGFPSLLVHQGQDWRDCLSRTASREKWIRPCVNLLIAVMLFETVLTLCSHTRDGFLWSVPRTAGSLDLFRPPYRWLHKVRPDSSPAWVKWHHLAFDRSSSANGKLVVSSHNTVERRQLWHPVPPCPSNGE